MTEANQNSPSEQSGEATSTPDTSEVSTNKKAASESNESRWVAHFEELLKVKNFDDLKSGLTKLASEIQTEIQSFDINAHLSPEAKTRLKSLEQRYAQITRYIQKAQKQFDREFNKSVRVLMRTKQDAEKQLKNIRVKITKHRGTILKASKDLSKKIKNKTKKSAKKTSSGPKRSKAKKA